MHRMLAIALGALSLTILSTPLPAQSGGEGAYRIGPRDRISIEVREVPRLNTDQQVSGTGTVRLPEVGEVEVAGRTPGALAAELEAMLEEQYLERATVRVEVLEVLSRSVSIIGAVNRPGEVGLPGDWSLLEALTAAGGLAENRGEEIHVLRRADNGLSDQISISVEQLVSRADPTLNIPIFPNDIINVEPVETVKIYMLGEVAGRGVLEFQSTERITLLVAIARAGGLGDRASPKILIKRRRDDGSLEQIHANYKRILAGKEPDVTLEDGDLLVVKESFF